VAEELGEDHEVRAAAHERRRERMAQVVVRVRLFWRGVGPSGGFGDLAVGVA
jgi:hypothetical protein